MEQCDARKAELLLQSDVFRVWGRAAHGHQQKAPAALSEWPIRAPVPRYRERLPHLSQGCVRRSVEQRLVAENPTKTLTLPHTRERETYTVPFEDVQRLEDALDGRDKIIFRLLGRCGPRAGETFAFQWHDLQPDQTLRIQRTYSRGELKPPKTKKSRKPIYLPLSLYRDLLRLREVSDDPSPTGWIFPSQRKRRRHLENGELEASASIMPLDYHNWVNRNLKPVADKMGIRVNCQI